MESSVPLGLSPHHSSNGDGKEDRIEAPPTEPKPESSEGAGGVLVLCYVNG